MKKLLTAIAVASLSMSLVGCGSGSSNSSADSDTFTVGMECNYAPLTGNKVRNHLQLPN